MKYLQIQGGDFAPIAQKVKILKKEKTMALIIANKITLHGNEQIKNLRIKLARVQNEFFLGWMRMRNLIGLN